MLAGGAACAREAKTPEAAARAFVDAVRARDGRRLYESLDLETRWSWMTIHRARRDAREIIMSSFPAERRERELARSAEGAEAAREVELFLTTVDDKLWEELGRGLADAPAVEAAGEGEARVRTRDGRALVFRRGQRGGWGFAGLAEPTERLKRRALADLDLVKASAADYERAAARGP
jgi:hypothetical protein